MLCEVQGIWSWGDNDCYESLSNIPAQIDAPLVAATESVECAGPEIWTLAWILRRQLWRDLIASGLLETVFFHDNEAGEGAASMRFPLASGNTVAFEAGGFLRSDGLHINNAPEAGLFSLYSADGVVGGWTELILSNLEYEDFDDSDLYEYSFRSVDLVTLNPKVDSLSASWPTVDDAVQVDAIAALLFDHEQQLAEYGEVVLGHEDVLAAAAAHPASAPEVWQLIADRASESSRVILAANTAVPTEIQSRAQRLGELRQHRVCRLDEGTR